jgi:hypothetical protein
MANLCIRATRSSGRWSSRSGRPGLCTRPAYRGYLERVRRLVEAGADVMARDERFGATALDWAGWTKQDAVVAYLRSGMKAADRSGG